MRSTAAPLQAAIGYHEGRQQPINKQLIEMRNAAMSLLIHNPSSAAISAWFRERRTIQ
jgi:hypothetical protein